MRYKSNPKSEIDILMSQAFDGMIDQEILQIKYIVGFEKFGSYETWGGGWVVSGKGLGTKEIVASDSRIELAVKRWLKKYKEANST